MAKLRVDKIASVGVSTETTGSVFFDGTGDYLRINDNDDFAFGTGDFTVEAWVKRNGTQSDNSTIVCTHNNDQEGLIMLIGK